jgi:hypothetical protein
MYWAAPNTRRSIMPTGLRYRSNTMYVLGGSATEMQRRIKQVVVDAELESSDASFLNAVTVQVGNRDKFQSFNLAGQKDSPVPLAAFHLSHSSFRFLYSGILLGDVETWSSHS